MAYDMFPKVPIGDPQRKDYLEDELRKRFVWADGKPRRARGKVVDELAALNKAEAWDEVLNRIVALRKNGTVGPDTIRKLREENPYRS